jgi:acyl-CoA synthetase (AMP-forming)/AMP-acid ligase II
MNTTRGLRGHCRSIPTASLRHDRIFADRGAAALEGAHRRWPRQGTSQGCRASHTRLRARIVDADDKTVPFGTVGEIVVRGDNVIMTAPNEVID